VQPYKERVLAEKRNVHKTVPASDRVLSLFARGNSWLPRAVIETRARVGREIIVRMHQDRLLERTANLEDSGFMYRVAPERR